VQPLPTETGPRSVCAHCGERLPEPNGSATFVYGVGPVGYQSCASCGAKWRYLWQDSRAVRVKPDRGRRLVVGFGALALVALVVVGGVALAESKPWDRSDQPAQPATSSAPATTTASTGAPADLTAAGFRYLGTTTALREGRLEFMRWLVDSATATPQFRVNEHTDEYLAGARAAIQSLRDDPSWPPEVAAEIETFVDAAQRFVDDLEPVYSGQAGSPSYITMISEASQTVDAADAAVRRELGLSQDSE
jgi:hypothetical protein